MPSRATARSSRAGWAWAHSIIDDHSRLLSEVLDDERAETVVAFTVRALGLVAAHGIDWADRLMTDVKVKRTGLVGGEIPEVLPGVPARAVSAWGSCHVVGDDGVV